jgi:putative ABC transport system substrate-binding protein
MALAVTPRIGRAQSKVYRIGFLGLSSPADYAPYLKAFLAGLRELGYEDGRNLAIEYRWAEGRDERLAGLAAQLVAIQPDVLVTHAIGVLAAQKATSTIPIVIGASSDPVALGLVKSLAKPGGNTTGVASQIVDLAPKRLELLIEVVPTLKRVAVLSNLAQPASAGGLHAMDAVAHKRGIRMQSFGITASASSVDAAFDALLRGAPDGLVVQPDPITGKHGVAIGRLAVKHRLPSIGGGRQFAADGGLLAYGGSFVEGWRLAARYVDRILRGARPGDLPVEQPTTFELAVNLGTAKDLDLALPRALLLRATDVIQ